ncbi:MAG: response regulator [Deltaproteobacteria bacterium]|nr:response regulator [Deltaproteobacteria bacterium]
MSTARVLVVDDNAALADNLREILEDAGYEVRVAGSAAAAQEVARDGFEVALVDVRLPDGDGTRLTERLRALAPESAVVLLTGFAALDTAIDAVRAGAFAYLVKPASTPHLLLTVEQALRQVTLHAEKRALARRAQVAEKLAAVGTMTAGLSHEIRNPLNGAALQLTVLERRVRKLPADSQPGLLEPLLLVRDEIRRLEHLVQDFLQFARPVELRAGAVPLHEVAAAVTQLLGGDAERRQVTLSCAVPETLPRVWGDGEKLRQVLMNLTLNAFEATPAGGQVRIQAHAASTEVELTVDDSGPGIPAEVQEHLFEPFFTTKAAGSGLGLSIVHAIVAQHGGVIHCERGPLGGARFRVTLPLAP